MGFTRMEHPSATAYADMPDGAVSYYQGKGWAVVVGSEPSPTVAPILVCDADGDVIGWIRVEPL